MEEGPGRQEEGKGRMNLEDAVYLMTMFGAVLYLCHLANQIFRRK